MGNAIPSPGRALSTIPAPGGDGKGIAIGELMSRPLGERIHGTVYVGSSSDGMEPTREVSHLELGNLAMREDKCERGDGQVGIGGDVTIAGHSEHKLDLKHKVFLSHSGAQKDFVEQLCVDLERCDRYPFFDKSRSSLPIGEKFAELIFDAIEQCQVGVVILSEEFFMRSKWPMLELNAMVKEFERPNPRIRIIPVFYLISLDALKDEKYQSRWTSQWEKWALNDKRVNVGEWKKALRVLRSIHGLVLKDGYGDVKFREEIVVEVCRFVRAQTRWDDSHVQGRSRSCKVIQEKMDQVASLSKVCIVGLYGMGGIGKTTISKALCNELSSKFCDNVCHIELGSRSEMAMLQSALRKLTNMRHDVLDKLDDEGEGYAYLKSKLCNQPMFLVVDNVQDDFKSIDVVQKILRAGNRCGNFLLVIARSLETLKRLYLDEANCLEMPTLEEDEARSLFLASTNLPLGYKVDGALVKDCIQRCFFSKGDGKHSHYHPLALKVLGQHLGCNTTQWGTKLNRIKRFCELQDRGYPVFSILRSSFDSLDIEHQHVFMDLALRVIYYAKNDEALHRIGCMRQEWLCIVYNCSAQDIDHMLKVLKNKSLLEDFGNDFSQIGIHDLWIEFAIAETKSQDYKDMRWMYHMDEKRLALGRRDRFGESVERMCFLNKGWKALNGLVLSDFVNTEVFMLDVDIYSQDWILNLDLKGLKYLKCLNLKTPGLTIQKVDGLSSLTNLAILMWETPGFSPCFDEIGRLTNLQFLLLEKCKGVQVLNFDELNLLRMVVIKDFPNLISIKGLSSKLAKLQALFLGRCMLFKKCRGLGELHALEVLRMWECGNLKMLPSIERLVNLRELDILKCKCIGVVPRLGDLVALEIFRARECRSLSVLPDMRKLTRLRELDIRECPVQEVPGMDGLVALTNLKASFDHLLRANQLVFPKLSVLKEVRIIGWKGTIWAIVQNLPLLETLSLSCCEGEDVVVPDLHNLERLNYVLLADCNVKDLSGLSNLSTLETLHVYECETLERLPELEKLSKLTTLGIARCQNLRHWPSSSNLCLSDLRVDEFSLMRIAPDRETLASVRELTIYFLQRVDVLWMASLSRLEVLDIWWSEVTEGLDVSNVPQVKELLIDECRTLRGLSCGTTLTALTKLRIHDCGMLVEMPDLSMFPHLEDLEIKNCRALTRLSCSRSLTAMKSIRLFGCDPEIETPNLKWFPNVKEFRVADNDYI